MDRKNKISQRAFDLGIDLIGFSRARVLPEVQRRLEVRFKEGRQTGLEWQDIGQRVDPESVFPGVKTIITAGLSYFKQAPPRANGVLGKVSRSAWGRDYHHVLREKLIQLGQFITNEWNGEVEVFVDTGPPVDRALALEAGLGRAGKNCSLINPRFGSWIFIGSIYTNLEIEADSPLESECGECELCLKACPTGALREPYIIEPQRCVSYLTQMKGFVPRAYRSLMGTNIYGCDACQQVCPSNRNAEFSNTPDFVPEQEAARPALLELISINNKSFKEIFGQSAASWRGRTVLQRNALIALGNLKNKETAQAVATCLKDQRPVIRGHAAWALGEIKETMGLPELRRALATEQDPQVVEELQLAIQKLEDKK